MLNKIIFTSMVGINIYLVIAVGYLFNENRKLVNESKFINSLSYYRLWDQAHEMKSHCDDFKEGNAWYFMELFDQPKYLGRSWLVKDNNGIKVISEYDMKLINRVKTERSAQQVDSAEASTIAVPPSNPSGSPR